MRERGVRDTNPVRPEPRLRLGTVEAASLAPLVTPWLERGCTERDLARALLPGLPTRMYSAAGVLRDRLVRKLPPPPEPTMPAPAAGPAAAGTTARWHECGRCGVPVTLEGICRVCTGLGARPVSVGAGAGATARGIARVRAAIHLAVPLPAPN